MLALGPISSRAIAALPDSLINALLAGFTARVTYEAVPFSPYLQLVNSQGTRIVYTLELNIRAVV
jgi:hypothetical protein